MKAIGFILGVMLLALIVIPYMAGIYFYQMYRAK